MNRIAETVHRYYAGARRRKRWLVAGARVLAADKLGLRSDRPKVLSNSVPKSGTNLLSRCLDLMPGLTHTQIWMNRPQGVADLRARLQRVYPGGYIKGHVVYRPPYARLLQELGLKTLLIVRDPRDLAVSLLHWVTYKNKEHRLHPYFSHLADDDTRLLAIIHGVPAGRLGTQRELEPINRYVGDFLPWIDRGACLVRFERLIGPAGDGSRQRQFDEIRKIAAYLEIPLTDVEAEQIAANVFSTSSNTFRKGQIGNWTDHFKPVHVDAFKEVAGDLLVAMEYEVDGNWAP